MFASGVNIWSEHQYVTSRVGCGELRSNLSVAYSLLIEHGQGQGKATICWPIGKHVFSMLRWTCGGGWGLPLERYPSFDCGILKRGAIMELCITRGTTWIARTWCPERNLFWLQGRVYIWRLASYQTSIQVHFKIAMKAHDMWALWRCFKVCFQAVKDALLAIKKP